MSGSKDVPISPDRLGGSAAPKFAVEHFELDVTKVAALVADGEVGWPTDLTEAQATALTKAVRELNRSPPCLPPTDRFAHFPQDDRPCIRGRFFYVHRKFCIPSRILARSSHTRH